MMNNINKALEERGGQMAINTLPDGELLMTATLDQERQGILSVGVIVEGPQDLDAGGDVLVSAIDNVNGGLTIESAVDEDASLVAGRCAVCNDPVVFIDGEPPVEQITCPWCAADQQRVELWSLALQLASVRVQLERIASEGSVETAADIVPVIGDLDRLVDMLDGGETATEEA